MEIKLVKKVLEENDSLAAEVKKRMRQKKQSLYNFMSSPGSGKTQLLQKLIPVLKQRGLSVAVIEGDIATTNDAQRLQPLDIPIAQINTDQFGGDCHLAASIILTALESLEATPTDIVIIENVGNLVCPAEFDTGADTNVVLLSITEGEDKPLKYPLMFRNSHVALINKVDIKAAIEPNIDLMKLNILQINPAMHILETSGKSGEGIDSLANWMIEKHQSI